ncbi:MAG TPA: hypothetical protein VL001_07745 [Candidimonas sp.]|nr:hypothetical protein [Candidimonas sp.]
MKKTDLEKNKALKLVENMKKGSIPNRFGTESSAVVVDRREQRRLDQAQGLVSFPVKLKQTLIEDIRARAAAQDIGINELVGTLLANALNAQADQKA